MIYNNANTSNIGKPVLVFDANGLEWDRCLEVDTESGRILRYRTDSDGRPILSVDGELEKETTFTAPPLLVVPISSFSSGDNQQ